MICPVMVNDLLWASLVALRVGCQAVLLAV